MIRIGIDLGGTKIEAIALADNGDTLYRTRIPTPRSSYADILDALVRLVADAEAHTGERGSVGIGIPGTPSPQDGRVKNSNIQHLNGQPLAQDLSARLTRPVRIENDANCMAVSEAIDGAGAGHGIVLALILGTGCGSGIVIHGRAHTGLNGLGGEWGHNPLPWMDDEERAIAAREACYCGQHGCIEHFVSGTGLSRDYHRLSGHTRRSDEIAALAEQGDPHAESALAAFERRLAKALAAYLNILDPDIVIFAGGLCHIERLYRTIPPLIPPYIFGRELRTPIRKALHGDASGVRGAAWLWPKKDTP